MSYKGLHNSTPLITLNHFLSHFSLSLSDHDCMFYEYNIYLTDFSSSLLALAPLKRLQPNQYQRLAFLLIAVWGLKCLWSEKCLSKHDRFCFCVFRSGAAKQRYIFSSITDNSSFGDVASWRLNFSTFVPKMPSFPSWR